MTNNDKWALVYYTSQGHSTNILPTFAKPAIDWPNMELYKKPSDTTYVPTCDIDMTLCFNDDNRLYFLLVMPSIKYYGSMLWRSVATTKVTTLVIEKMGTLCKRLGLLDDNDNLGTTIDIIRIPNTSSVRYDDIHSSWDQARVNPDVHRKLERLYQFIHLIENFKKNIWILDIKSTIVNAFDCKWIELEPSLDFAGFHVY